MVHFVQFDGKRIPKTTQAHVQRKNQRGGALLAVLWLSAAQVFT